MSSAILYVAIVAIWAGVLIPRWLRRDSSASAASSGGSASSGGPASSGGSGGERAGGDRTTAETEPAVTEEPAPRSRHRHDTAAAVRSEGRLEERSAVRPGEPAAGGAELPRDGPRDQEHKVLSARRRLLGMLLVLVTGSGALAFTRLAAWWVVVPPVIMLMGYTALLREAAKADAERRELARTRAVAADAAASPAAASPAASAAAASARAASPAAPPAPAPDAEVIDLSASLTPADEEPYDQYADAKLRAVGDLARSLAS